MKDRVALMFLITFIVYGILGTWQLTFNPSNWFTKVESGQIWICDNCDGDPFDCERKDTISIIDVRGNYVKVINKPWYGNGVTVDVTYRKQLFNQSSFHKIK